MLASNYLEVFYSCIPVLDHQVGVGGQLWVRVWVWVQGLNMSLIVDIGLGVGMGKSRGAGVCVGVGVHVGHACGYGC